MSTAKYSPIANSRLIGLRPITSSRHWWRRAILLVTVFATCTCILLARRKPLLYNSLPSKDDTSFNSTSLPVVMWHGMGDSCCASWSIGALQQQIQEALPGTFVHSIATGAHVGDDTLGGYIGNVNDQVAAACAHLASIPQLSKGYNAVGFSQGGQFLRAILERCQHEEGMPKMNKLITLGGQHQGIMNVPGCTGPSFNQGPSFACKVVQRVLGFGAYLPWIRSHVIQAQYFKDPYHYDKFLAHNQFLADINNERPHKQQRYKESMLSLKQLVLVRFSDDNLVVPRDSAWFGYWDGQQLQSMKETQLYQEDWIGLRQLDEAGRVLLEECPGQHMHVTSHWFGTYVIQAHLRT
ncbi:hypothetical protein ABBQ32_000606 [Trebouxia sp. C0010 RCD-2024]